MKLEDRVQVPLVNYCQQFLNCKISLLVLRNMSDFVIEIGCPEIDIFKFAVVAAIPMFILLARPIR